MNSLASYLAQHRFKDLFIEALGWDHASGMFELALEDRVYPLSAIAQKRGLVILHGRADHATLYNRGRLRKLQRKLAAEVHEQVVIYSCENPRKQVWQWALRLGGGRRLRHREHPFLSESPPPQLLARLARLRFTLDEEDLVTVLDATDRVRAVLDASAEYNLFVNRPRYVERSEQLAAAAENGGDAEFHAFILFHRPLVRWAVRPYVRLYCGDVEDAEQSGMLGLIYAARHYDRRRGVQFSAESGGA